MGTLVHPSQLAIERAASSPMIPTSPPGRRERMAKEMERAQDDMFTLARAALAKVAERIKGMNPRGFGGGPGTCGAADAV